MNGLKAINEAHGHPAADGVIRAFFQTISAVMADVGDAYRNGGDEVVLTFQALPPDGAQKVVQRLFGELAKEPIDVDNGNKVSITCSCGIAFTADPMADPEALLKRADDANGRAKERTRSKTGRPSDLEVDTVPLTARPQR